ncbi:MAG: SdrD B-like domain-containing protein, partial [Saprospiraceae bacterium]
ALGNFVWNDLNADGDQDAGEPGISGVTVTLTNVTTSATTPGSTDANGKYLFSGLKPGTYKVTFGTPSGYIATTPNVGADDKDSDPVSGVTGNYTLISGQTDSTVDAGFHLIPDLQPTIFILPTSFTVDASTGYSRAVRLIVRVAEVSNMPTDGSPIVVRIPRTSKLTFTYVPTLTSLGSTTLLNSAWTFGNSNPAFWEFTYYGTFPPYGVMNFGFTGTFFSEGETGQMFFNCIVVNGSGGETNFLNNVDDERVDFITD